MSRYAGNYEACPGCGLLYRDLRTGLTWGDVFSDLWSHSEDTCEWKYKRRNTVLGRWHMYKKQLWERHLEECRPPPRRKKRMTKRELSEYLKGVPF